MADAQFDNRFPQYRKQITDMCDSAMRRMSADLVTEAKMTVPMKDGQLISSINYKKIDVCHYEVEANAAYALYQERGMREDGSHVVRKYTTGGTRKGFMKSGAKEVVKNIKSYFGMWSK